MYINKVIAEFVDIHQLRSENDTVLSESSMKTKSIILRYYKLEGSKFAKKFKIVGLHDVSNFLKDHDDYADMDYYYGRRSNNNKQELNDLLTNKYISENNENLKTRLKNAREKLVRMKNAEKLKKSDQDYNLDREQPDIASDYIFGRSYSAEKQPYEEDGYRIIKFGDTVSNYRTSDKKVKHPNKLNIDYDDTNMDELVQFFGKLIEKNSLPPKKKQRDDGTLAIYLEAMDQVIRNNDKSLAQYDWLSTTVDVQAALKKLSLITYAVQQAKELNPGDIQLLKYILNLYEASKSLDTLPRNRNQDSNNPYTYGSLQNDLNVAVVKMKVNSYRAYANLARRSNNKLDLNGFVIFLDDLKSGLNELHNTIKHIAIITKFRQQHWYEDLKLLYLKDPSKKQLIEVLLHLFTTRLVGLIEDGAQNGVLENYKVFMRNNKDVVQKSVLELDFVLKLLKEFKKL